MATAPTKTIHDLGIELSTESEQTLVLDPITLPAGRTLADWASFSLTVREDPDWPRVGADKHAAKSADPEGDGWAVAFTVAGTPVGATVEFAITEADSDVGAGVNRYAFDCWGIGGSAGRVQLVEPTWLTMRVRAVARA